MSFVIDDAGAFHGGVCQLDRYLIGDLALRLNEGLPNFDSRDLEVFLQREVNFKPSREKTDPVFKEHQDRFKSDNSISAFEAATFIRNVIEGKVGASPISAAVAKGLEEIYFSGNIYKLPPPHLVKIGSVHDGDTPVVLDSQDSECNAGKTATTKVRTSGVDAPEIGYKGWVNPKLADNANKINAQISEGKWDPKKLSSKEREAINKIISATIDYTGQLSKIAVEDFFSWGRSAAEMGVALATESQINWISDDTPEILCWMWQPYDTYARRLVSFRDTEKGRLARYIREGLPSVMEQRGTKEFEKYKSDIRGYLEVLAKSKVEGLYATARAMVDSAPDPVGIYSRDNCENMATAFESLGEEAADNVQAMQIVIGSVYDYVKYRNQEGEIYKAAGEIARAHSFGFWTDTSFKSLWDYNMKTNSERYNPPECPAKP